MLIGHSSVVSHTLDTLSIVLLSHGPLSVVSVLSNIIRSTFCFLPATLWIRCPLVTVIQWISQQPEQEQIFSKYKFKSMWKKVMDSDIFNLNFLTSVCELNFLNKCYTNRIAHLLIIGHHSLISHWPSLTN